MSPHVANFVHDLVAMAKAMEENPVLQDQIDALRAQLGTTQDHNAGLEINIISYKQQIDDLQATVRSLEVERDEASFHALEQEDLVHTALSEIDTMQLVLGRLKYKLSPPSQPEPVVEPVPELPQAVPSEPDTAFGHFEPDGTLVPVQGQSESPPPVTGSEVSTSPVASTAESVDTPSAHSEPTQGQSEGLPIVNPVPTGQDANGTVGVGFTENTSANTDADPEPELRWSHEWYQWYDRRNAEEHKRVFSR